MGVRRNCWNSDVMRNWSTRSLEKYLKELSYNVPMRGNSKEVMRKLGRRIWSGLGGKREYRMVKLLLGF